MKITRKQLQRIIKEEMEKIFENWEPGTTLVPERPPAPGGVAQFGEYGAFEDDPATLEQIIKALKDAGMYAAAEHLEKQYGLEGPDEWESLT
tara:strand:- start:203 stop:478 length:276 start_codon:yes stop_codon:yes gene_type:complete